MSPLRLNGSTSGFSQLDAPAIAGDQTFTLPGTGGTIDRLNRAGNILQVVQTTKIDFFTTSSTTFVDVTGFSATITPTAASNRILIISHLHVGNSLSGNEVRFQLRRGSTNIFEPTAGTARNQTLSTGNLDASNNIQNMACTFLDAPNTTSATTYSFQVCTTNGTIRFNGRGDGDFSGNTSSITLLEVAA